MIQMHPPSNFTELTDWFGDIARYTAEDGTLLPSWEERYIARINLPEPVPYAFDPKVSITRVTVHVALADVVRRMYWKIHDAGMFPALGPYGGGYQYRANRNDHTRVSLHAWGLAWDWDPEKFPNHSKATREPKLVEITSQFGMRWGEVFQHPDPMHMSFSTGAIG